MPLAPLRLSLPGSYPPFAVSRDRALGNNSLPTAKDKIGQILVSVPQRCSKKLGCHEHGEISLKGIVSYENGGDDSHILSNGEESAFSDNTLHLAALLVGKTESYETLEHPSMAGATGSIQGSVTLDFWWNNIRKRASCTDVPNPQIPINFLDCYTVLQHLEGIQGLPKEVNLSSNDGLFYVTNLRIPDETVNQLISIINQPFWIDFTSTENQLLGRHMNANNLEDSSKFLNQLLISVELYTALHSPNLNQRQHVLESIRTKPRVLYNLALAQRWIQNISLNRVISPINYAAFYTFDIRRSSRQIQALKVFATQLKWPCIDFFRKYLDSIMYERMQLNNVHLYAVEWLSGLVFPGSTLPILIMRCLVALDRSVDIDPHFLSPKESNCGFQYSGATYWLETCVLGKVLSISSGVSQVAGWVGPCISSPDIEPTQGIRVYTKACKKAFKEEDIKTIGQRSHPQGSKLDDLNPSSFVMLLPDYPSSSRPFCIQKLNFRRHKRQSTLEHRHYEAMLAFTFGHRTLTIELKYDVSFISAKRCTEGPHPLHKAYACKFIDVFEIIEMSSWAHDTPVPQDESSDKESDVLVIEAYGTCDSVVFARAWCSQWGFSAIVANVAETCIACAVRAAYAAKIRIVICSQEVVV